MRSCHFDMKIYDFCVHICDTWVRELECPNSHRFSPLTAIHLAREYRWRSRTAQLCDFVAQNSKTNPNAREKLVFHIFFLLLPDLVLGPSAAASKTKLATANMISQPDQNKSNALRAHNFFVFFVLSFPIRFVFKSHCM